MQAKGTRSLEANVVHYSCPILGQDGQVVVILSPAQGKGMTLGEVAVSSWGVLKGTARGSLPTCPSLRAIWATQLHGWHTNPRKILLISVMRSLLALWQLSVNDS